MKSPGPYGRYLATGSTLSSQICAGQSIDWFGRDVESLATEALLSDWRKIWLCSYHAPSHYSTRNSAKKGLHCKRSLAFNIKRTPRTGSCPLSHNTVIYWHCYLKRECGWQMAVPWGWVAITQGQRQSSTNQSEQSYHAVVASVEFKCTVYVISLNSHQ